ncbi:MAG: tetratricopeptide repeat protein [Bryobacteraceae bacterium]
MVVLPILLFSVVATCEESLKPATLALQQKEPAKALSLLEPLRTTCAQSSSFYEILGLANELSGNADAGEEALRTAVSLDSRSARLLTELGATYLRNGKPSEAEKILNQALVLDPSNTVTIKYAIGAAVGSHDWQRAATLFEQIGAGKNPAALQQEPVLVLWFAQTMIETHQNDRVGSLLSSLQGPMPPGLLFSLGTLFAQHGMYQRAVNCLKEIPAQNADDAVYFNLGLSYSHLGQFNEAREFYFQAIDKHPEHVDAYFHVGLDYAASGEPRMGIPWLFRAHGLAPARPDIAYALGEQLIALEYFNSANEVVAQALDSNPHDALLVVANGDLKRAQGDTAAAIDSYRKALTEKPELTAALVGLARASIAQGNENEAKSFLKTALSHDPEDPFVNGELGLLEARQHDWDAALDHLRRAWTQNRSNPDIALELARAYERKNRPLDALQLLASISPVMQESSAFHFELAQIYALLHRSADAQAERDTLTSLQARTHNALHFENPRTYVH